jgi:hypothetical protein
MRCKGQWTQSGNLITKLLARKNHYRNNILMKIIIFWDITPWLPAFMLVSCSAYSSTPKTEAICSFETSAGLQWTTRRYIPEDSSLHNHRCENHKSYNILMFSNAVKGYHYSSSPTHMFWSMERYVGNNVSSICGLLIDTWCYRKYGILLSHILQYEECFTDQILSTTPVCVCVFYYIKIDSYVANYMGQSSSWEGNSHFTGQRLSLLVRTRSIHRRGYTNLQLEPLLSQMNQYHTSFCFINIYFSILLPSMTVSPKWPYLAKFLCVLNIPILRATYPSHLTFLDLTTVIVLLRVKIMKFSLYNFLHALFTFSSVQIFSWALRSTHLSQTRSFIPI